MSRKTCAILVLTVLIVGCFCAFYLPEYQCDTIGTTFCQISPILGYVAFGMAGIIILREIFMQIRKSCRGSSKKRLRGHRNSGGRIPLLWDRISQPHQERKQDQRNIRISLLFQQRGNYYDYNRKLQRQQDFDYLPTFLDNPSEKDSIIIYNQKALQYRQSFNQNQCSICLEDLQEDGGICRIRCGHKFHSNCIEDWFIKHQDCPICRNPIC